MLARPLKARFASASTCNRPHKAIRRCLATVSCLEMKQTEFSFENDRGHKLLGAEFVPDSAQQQWATLIWHHGVCEHSGRYTPGKLYDYNVELYSSRVLCRHMCVCKMFCLVSMHPLGSAELLLTSFSTVCGSACIAIMLWFAVFQHMADAGVAVYTFDVHGHGRSEPSVAGDRGLIKSYAHLVRFCLPSHAWQAMAHCAHAAVQVTLVCFAFMQPQHVHGLPATALVGFTSSS